jgi:hypothetical protein
VDDASVEVNLQVRVALVVTLQHGNLVG